MYSLHKAAYMSKIFPFVSRAQFHSNPTPSASILFQLQGLSNSREGQWLAKASGLPRQEYSAALQLIKSSEVDPFKKPHPPVVRSQRLVSAYQPATIKLSVADFKALSIGRRVMATHKQEVQGLKRRLSRLQRAQKIEKDISHAENQRLRKENKSATVAILLAVAVATGLASWRFTPSRAPSAAVSREPPVKHSPLILEPVTLTLEAPLLATPATSPALVIPTDTKTAVSTHNKRRSWFWSQ